MLLVLCAAFSVAAGLILAVGTAVISSLTGDAAVSDTAGIVAAGAAGAVGVLAAVLWRSRVTERTVTIAQLRATIFVALAIAEVGMLLGLVWGFFSQSPAPLWTGAAFYALSLVLVATGIARADVAQLP